MAIFRSKTKKSKFTRLCIKGAKSNVVFSLKIPPIVGRLNEKRSKTKQKRNKTKRKRNKKLLYGGARPMNFGMLFPIPRDVNEAGQIDIFYETIKTFKPKIIGLVSPTDAPGDEIHKRTRMWKLFAEKIKAEKLDKFVMQHLPYTSVGNIGKITDTRLTMPIINKRISDIKEEGINNILALKGWEENQNYLEPGQVTAEQPEYLFRNTPDWIKYVREQFTGFIAATTYIEGHPFRRNIITAESPDWWAVKTEYTHTGGKFKTGILKSNLILGIKYDIEKIKAGANIIICNMIFDVDMFLQYKELFEENVEEEYKDKYEIMPEIPIGISKRSFYNDSLLSSIYCNDVFQDNILKAGQDTFAVGDEVLVIGKEAEFANTLLRKNYHKATITSINDTSSEMKKYTVTFINSGEIETDIPILRISSIETDIKIAELWKEHMKDILKTLYYSQLISCIYIVSVDAEAAKTFISECLDLNILIKTNYEEMHKGGSKNQNQNSFQFGGIRL
jgi:5,10-methylenetetrahydrofolate reductase